MFQKKIVILKYVFVELITVHKGFNQKKLTTFIINLPNWVANLNELVVRTFVLSTVPGFLHNKWKKIKLD